LTIKYYGRSKLAIKQLSFVTELDLIIWVNQAVFKMYYYEEIRNEIFPILGVSRLIRKPIKMDDLVEDLREELKSIDYTPTAKISITSYVGTSYSIWSL
jgi:hypothetical protein